MARIRLMSASNAGSTASWASAAPAPQIMRASKRHETGTNRDDMGRRAYTSPCAGPAEWSARQTIGVARLAVGAPEFARHRPQVAIAVIDVRALPNLSFDRLGLAVAPGVAAIQGQLRCLAVVHFRLVKLGVLVGQAHQALLPAASGR